MQYAHSTLFYHFNSRDWNRFKFNRCVNILSKVSYNCFSLLWLVCLPSPCMPYIKQTSVFKNNTLVCYCKLYHVNAFAQKRKRININGLQRTHTLSVWFCDCTLISCGWTSRLPCCTYMQPQFSSNRNTLLDVCVNSYSTYIISKCVPLIIQNHNYEYAINPADTCQVHIYVDNDTTKTLL